MAWAGRTLRSMARVLVGGAHGAHLWEGGRLEPVDALAERSTGPFGVDDAGTVWAIVDGRELWSAADPGGAWRLSAVWDGDPLTCVVPFDGGALAGTAGAHVVHVDAGRRAVLDTCFDGLPERSSWYTPWGAPPDARSLAVDGAVAYVNVHVGGVARGRPAEAWTALVDIDVDVHQVLAGSGTVLLATGAAGFGVSHDGGGSWSFRAAGLHGTYLRAVIRVGDIAIVSASTGPSTQRGTLYRTVIDDDGAPFERARGDLPEWFTANVDTHALASHEGFAACAGPDGTLYVSDDAGATWSAAARAAATMGSLAVIP
jgi:hypothetical protein